MIYPLTLLYLPQINPKYDPDITHTYVQFYSHIIKSLMTVSRSYCHAIGLQIDISCLYRHLIELLMSVSRSYCRAISLQIDISHLYRHIT